MRLQRVGHHWATLTHSYWSRLPFPSPGDLSYPGIKPISFMSPALAGGFFTTSANWAPPWDVQRCMKFINDPPKIYCGRHYSRCWECCRWTCNWSRKNTSNKVVKRHQGPHRQGTVFCQRVGVLFCLVEGTSWGQSLTFLGWQNEFFFFFFFVLAFYFVLEYSRWTMLW